MGGQVARQSRSGGLGIGLFLANATIERAGGSVQLKARAGGGTLSAVRLPLAGEGGRT